MSEVQGKFVVIEGLEGAGKSSAINLVRDYIEKHTGRRMICTREPGGTPLAEKMRELVKQVDKTDPLCDEAECLLIYAARVQLVANVIKPALNGGQCVLGDRHNLSSLAYQGGGRGLTELVDVISDATLKGFKPDLTLYLDVDPKIGLQRAASRGSLDRIEQQKIDFFERARARYLQIAAEDETIYVIDASQNITEVHKDIISVLQAMSWLN